MLLSLALILFLGFALGGILGKLKLPPLLGMMATGLILGPFALDIIDPSILTVSDDLRRMALIVILIRAGLKLDLEDLKQVGRPAILMCFLPATCELISVTLIAPLILGLTYLEAAILGAVLAAVSPAVIVPRMLRLMEEGAGQARKIPQLIMAGASVDDIYVLVLFTSFLGIYQGQSFQAGGLIRVPLSIFLGLGLGIAVGLFSIRFFKTLHMRDTVKLLLLLGLSFLFVSLEDAALFPISGLVAVMALGGTILKGYPVLAQRLSAKYEKLWVANELMLFVLVGAAVDLRQLQTVGFSIALLLLLALVFRSLGVLLSLTGTKLSRKERLFCVLSYLPKATVQAAIGGIPLSVGVASGQTIQAVAVLAILVTAPLGALAMDFSQKKLLGPGDT